MLLFIVNWNLNFGTCGLVTYQYGQGEDEEDEEDEKIYLKCWSKVKEGAMRGLRSVNKAS